MIVTSSRLAFASRAKLAVTSVVFLAMLAAAPSAEAEATVETLAECSFADPENGPALEKECGYVVLKENPERPDSPDIKLGYLRLPGRSDRPATPVFMLAGGPGQSLISPDTLMLFADAFLGPILNDRDVVILDQRGAPNSSPSLDCPEAYSLSWEVYDRKLDEAGALDLGRQILANCAANARKDGIDLAQYNSVRLAADVDAVREALGYEKIVFYGASYGSQLGQHFMRDFPQSLEAVVLDGANSLSRKSWVQERVRDADVAIQKLAALCEADAKCGSAYDVIGMVEQAMALFDGGTIETTYQDPGNPDVQLDVTVTQADMAGMIFGYQTGQIGIHALPAVLDAVLAEGRASAGTILGDQKGSAILASRGAKQGDSAMLMHMAVVCSDDPVTSSDDLSIDADASTYAKVYGQSVLEEYLEFCAAADVPSLPDETDVDVSTDVPTLILAGDLDARTPVIRSELVAATLPRATIVEFPQGTHVQLGEVNQCAGRILQAFLSDPNEKPDTGCIAEMPRRGFVLPDGTISIE